MMTNDEDGRDFAGSFVPSVEKGFFPRTEPNDGQASVQPRTAPRETGSLPDLPPAGDD
jgi:hypothetical protein